MRRVFGQICAVFLAAIHTPVLGNCSSPLRSGSRLPWIAADFTWLRIVFCGSMDSNTILDNVDGKNQFLSSVRRTKGLFETFNSSGGGKFMEPVRLLKER